MAQRPICVPNRVAVSVNGTGPTVPSGFTPPGMGCAVPMTLPFGAVNQKETASRGWKPRALKVMVSPTLPLLGVACPFWLPETSQPLEGGGPADGLVTRKKPTALVCVETPSMLDA